MALMLYILGFIIFITGLSYAASVLGLSHVWIAVGAILLFGLAIFTATTNTRQRDDSA